MRAACVQCRVRKVRCDGAAPSCSPCERLRFDCSFRHAGSKSVNGYAIQLPPKRRGSEACLECRAMKARCSRESPRCANCHRRNRQCTYASATRAANAQKASSTASSNLTAPSLHSPGIASDLNSANSVASGSVTSPLSTISNSAYLPDDISAQLISKYFECLSPLPSFNFLHEETVVQRCLDGSIDQPLRLAICAITSMFLGRHQEQRMDWASEAERLMQERLEKPSIFLIQASLLTIRFRAAVGQFPRAFILAGLAARWAVALRLNYEHSGLGPVAKEVRRRTLWSLFLLEDSFCVGLKEFELLSPEIMQIQLPCEDAVFNDRRPASTGYLQSGKGLEPVVLGPRASYIKLAAIRRDIIRFNRQICAQELTQPEMFACIERHHTDLLRVRTRFAPEDEYPPPTPREGFWPPQYALLHMSWHQCHCDLYRPFVTDYPELGPHAVLNGLSDPDRSMMRDKCLDHAEKIFRILSDFMRHKKQEHMLEHDGAVCAYHAARLILLGAENAAQDSDSMRIAINKAQLCLDVITQYFAFSAQLENMRKALANAIEQYKNRWKRSSRVETEKDLDPEPAEISRDARNRQRLAIHSLLRQSDFIDDSREAALEPPSTPAPASATATASATPLPPAAAEGVQDWNAQDAMYQPWNSGSNDTNGLYGMSFGATLLDFGGGMMQGPEEMENLLGGLDEQGMY